MSKVEVLRAAVTERMCAVAEEIFVLFERSIEEYEREMCRTQQENLRHRQLLDAVLKPQVLLHRAALPEDARQDAESTHTKEEQEGHWNNQRVERIQGLEEDPIINCQQNDEEEAQTSQLHQRQTEHSREEEPTASASAQQPHTGCDGEDPGGSDPDNNQPGNDETPDSPEQTGSSDGDDSKQSRERQWDINTATGSSVSPLASVNRTSDSSETETEDGKERRKPQLDLKRPTNNGFLKGGTGEKSLSCSECGKAFDTMGCAQNQTKRRPSGGQPSICSVCVQRSTQRTHLVTHKITQSGEKVFRCSICKKHFGYKGDAVRHVRIHTGEKPFSCSVCGKRFNQSTGLISHMRTHTGEKPFSCKFCPKRFIRSGILARHMRVHTGETPYSCSVCNRSFTLSQSLLKHTRIHTGEKPFSCSVCDKKFTQKGHLTQHMTLHTGDRSFSCSKCGRKFTRQSRVKNHKCVSKNGSKK